MWSTGRKCRATAIPDPPALTSRGGRLVPPDLDPGEDPAIKIAFAAGADQRVELTERRHVWDRDQMVAAEAADLALDAALLVRALQARPA
jgi:hypothetical protein